MDDPAEPPQTPIQDEAGVLLLVDDEENILSALKRVLRRDGYRILTANSGAEGLALLVHEHVDVILADQRMSGMTGTRFLSEAQKLKPETVRIVLSGYTELESVTAAINHGAVYRFLTKPWDDEQLRAHIAEAMRRKRMSDDNQRLQHELREMNTSLRALLNERERDLAVGQLSLHFAQETMAKLPVAVVSIDTEGQIEVANQAAQDLFGGSLLGTPFESALPAELSSQLAAQAPFEARYSFEGRTYYVYCNRLGTENRQLGLVLTLIDLQRLESR